MNEQRYKMPVSVQIILLNQKNEVLLSKRKSTGFCDGMYGLIGGHVEQGEQVINAIIRETKEEIGVKIKKEHINFKCIMNRKVDNTLEYIDFVFVVNNWNGAIANMEPEKCYELRWFDINNMPQNTIDFVKYLVNTEEKIILWGW